MLNLLEILVLLYVIVIKRTIDEAGRMPKSPIDQAMRLIIDADIITTIPMRDVERLLESFTEVEKHRILQTAWRTRSSRLEQ